MSEFSEQHAQKIREAVCDLYCNGDISDGGAEWITAEIDQYLKGSPLGHGPVCAAMGMVASKDTTSDEGHKALRDLVFETRPGNYMERQWDEIAETWKRDYDRGLSIDWSDPAQRFTPDED